MSRLRFVPFVSLAASACFVSMLSAGAQTSSAASQQTPAATPQQQTAPAANTAPQQQEESSSAVTTIRAFVPEVNLVFTVTDNKGHFITGLKQENFGLLDDGRPPERVTKFTQQTNLPLRVGVLLDTSNSIRQRFKFEQDAAVEFFLQVLHRGDAAYVEGFDVKTDLVQDYTNNIDKLNTAIHKLRPGGGTAFFDALYTSCRDQMLTIVSKEPIRKAIIIVSDGHDNQSRVRENDAIKMCQRAETNVYAISTNISPSRDRADEVLRRIAEATGGRAFYPTKIEDVAVGFHRIEEELRSQYSLVYRPADFKQDGSFRTIYLVARDPRYHVTTRKGYFAPLPQR
ncbi:MAG: VWA domain-containing protein [Acidobacteria bacterium]|nr:VWA domain-containing protein [Acidobacteriota bacterium]